MLIRLGCIVTLFVVSAAGAVPARACAAQDARPAVSRRGALSVSAGVAPVVAPEKRQELFNEGLSLRVAYTIAPVQELELSLALETQGFTFDEEGYRRFFGLAPGEASVEGNDEALRGLTATAAFVGAALAGRVQPYLFLGPGVFRMETHSATYQFRGKTEVYPAESHTDIGGAVGAGMRLLSGSRWSGTVEAGYQFVLADGDIARPVRTVPIRLGVQVAL